MAPFFSIVTPVYNTPLGVLEEMICSVQAQTVDDWELILVDDCSPDGRVRDLIRSFVQRDGRIRLIERTENGHIVKASNDGLGAARGEFVVFVDHDDLITPDALERNLEVIKEHEDVDYIYSDEDKVDESGNRFDPFHKPHWSPERLRGQMYTSHLSVMRADLVRELGGFRDGFDGSQDHDLALRVSERARRVIHIPEVLYHWRAIAGSTATERDAKPYASVAGCKAVQSHLDRVGARATAAETATAGVYRITWAADYSHLISVVIPTIGSSAMVWGTRRTMILDAARCLMEEAGGYDFEVVVVYDAPTPPPVLDELREIVGDHLVLVPFNEPFNYSRKMNVGVLHSRGSRLVFLNDDVVTKEPGWFTQILGPLGDPSVGLTGAKLYFGNTDLQHVGHVYAEGGYDHAYCGFDADFPGPFFMNHLSHEVSGVTGACTAMRRETFLEIGGFAESLGNNFNDVDLCYKVSQSGYRIVYVANAELFHFESLTRDSTVKQAEIDFMKARWGTPKRDPYFPDWRGR